MTILITVICRLNIIAKTAPNDCVRVLVNFLLSTTWHIVGKKVCT